MYISEFWCGVAATVFVEIAVIFAAAIICAVIPNKNDKGDKK